jgi:flavin-dependent dehydrogenase
LLSAVERAGFHPWSGNTVVWAGQDPRIEAFAPDAQGYQVVRSDLDRVLRDAAVSSGAQLLVGLVRDAGLPADSSDNDRKPTALVETREGRHAFEGRFILDCTGRTGVVARQGLRRMEPSLHTIALTGRWHTLNTSRIVPDTHTLVASYADGWAWSVSTGSDVRDFTVMVDPVRTNLTRGAPALDVYRAELAKVRAFDAVLARAQLTHGPWGADASVYCADRYAGPGYLLVGDAASFIDPLSSFGIKKALASAWVAAAVVHTAIDRPALHDEALGFHDRRERAVFASSRRQAGQFAVEAAVDTPHPFWLARVASDNDEATGEELDPGALARDPRVRAAFEDLRRRPELRLETGSALRLTSRAAIRGHEIVKDEHLILPCAPDGVRYIRGVDLVALARLAPEHSDVGTLYETFVRDRPAVALPDFLGALSTLIAFGVLVSGSER